ncbi:MAG: AAA family ATPase [Pseudomonadota bacterium]
MYEEFYDLSEKPFSIQPDPSFLYWGRTHRLAYAMLEYGVLNQAGISIVTGEVGCGKTTLIHRLLEQLTDSHTVALLSNIQRDRGDLLSWVLMGFGQPFRDMGHVEKFAALQRFFIEEYGKGRRIVLIIDEAQNLSIDMLEELRMLSNINAGKHQLLQLIMIGQPQLKQLLNRPDMLQLAQRVGADFHLTPLNREEVHAYIETRLAIAGASRRVFSEAAIDMIAKESRGVPRVINIIADTALVYGFSAGEAVVSEESIEAVIEDKGSYGVFGIASDADLELSEEPNVGPASFLAGETEAAEAVGRPNLRVAATGGGSTRPQASFSGAGGPTTLFPDLESAPRVKANLSQVPVSVQPAARAPSTSTSITPGRRQSDGGPDDANASDGPRVVSGVVGRADPVDATGPIGVVVYGDGAAETVASLADNEDVAHIVLVQTKMESEAASAPEGVVMADIAAEGLTPGRARNAGYRKLKKLAPDLRFVQFVGPNARLTDDWLSKAAAFLARRPEIAAVCGAETPGPEDKGLLVALRAIAMRRREGEVVTTNDSFFVRAEAFEAAGGFRGDIPDAETSDLCVRLRRRGAHIWRLEDEMTFISPPLRSLGGWMAAARRDGAAYAMRAALHGASSERLATAERARALIWGLWLPILIVLMTAAAGGAAFALAERSPVTPVLAAAVAFAAGLLIYGLKAAVMAFRLGPFRLRNWFYGVLMTLGHFGEAAGILGAGGRVRELMQSPRR